MGWPEARVWYMYTCLLYTRPLGESGNYWHYYIAALAIGSQAPGYIIILVQAWALGRG